MNIKETIYERKHLREVKHTTLNPYGPGVIRIHLIPPKVGKEKGPSVVILNGQDILPINRAWAILLSEFIDNINKYEGKEIKKEDLKKIVKEVLKNVKKIYPRTKRDTLKQDLKRIIHTFCQIAYGEEVTENIGTMTIGEYAPYMNAPHRMDLMISSMNKNGNWNCNQKCKNCYAAGQEQAVTKEISTVEWKEIIDKCRKAYIPQLTFTGGEPTLRNDLVELIAYSKWFVTRLNTNGILLSKELCKKLYDASLDSVQITLYSSTKKEHEKLTGSCNNFEKTVQGIQNAIDAGLNVSINTPLCKTNQDYVKTLEFAKKLGVKYVSCSGIIFTGNARNEEAIKEQLSEEELIEILEKATVFCRENNMEISFTSPGQVKEDVLRNMKLTVPSCGACLSNMAIAPNGDVVPCQSWLTSKETLGNMLEDSWEKIWNAPVALSIREFSASMKQTCPLKTKKGE